jgi:menaquinone-dependent protoporphyrinogen oxidase
MKAAVFYATREGQSERVATRIAADLREQRVDVDVANVKDLRAPIDWSRYQSAFVVASVHAGHHEREMVAFVRRNKEKLARLHASFLSLTLSQAGAEDKTVTFAQRAAARADALRMIQVFIEDTGWRPWHSLPVAGALAYSKYNFVMKLIMKHIARKAGFDGDTSRDYEFTNWPAVDLFVSDAVGSPDTALTTPAAVL